MHLNGQMQRATLRGSAGLAGTASLGAWALRTAPEFWRRFSADRKRAVLPAPEQPFPRDWPNTGLHAAWLGHSTVLFKIDGATVITDPVFSARVGLNLGPATLGLKRLVAAALNWKQLPPIDLVLLSHAHFDHFDKPSLRRLESPRTHVVTAAKTADLLRPGRWAGVHELGWGERIQVGPLEIRAFEVNHWGARMRNDSYRGYNGYTIESSGHRVLFGGDTAATHTFGALKRSRPFDLAIMPVGAYDPWIRNHCTPEQAWSMAEDAGFEFFLPVHHQTFALSREPYFEPIERVHKAAGRNQDRIAVKLIGQEFHL
jgi:L-ascorbate metabolism protein UlaG (beta-lactamase superfamily)